MNRDQIKKIVKLTEAIVNKRLTEADQFPKQMGSDIEFLDKRRAEFRSIMTSVFKFQDKYDVDIKVDSKLKTLRGLMDQIMGML